MKRFVIVASLMFSSTVFSVVPIDSGVGGECNCTCEAADDYAIGSGSCTGDCDCIVDCDGIDCVADCICLTEEADEDIDHENELIFDEVEDNMEDIDDTGMMGAGEGTYADYEEIYILDSETEVTNEVDITPSWCD